MKSPNPFLRRMMPLLLCVGLGGCAAVQKMLDAQYVPYPETLLENLDRLHTPTGKHHYTVRFVGNVENALGSNASIRGLRFGAPSSTHGQVVKQLRNPSETGFELLDDLLDMDGAQNPRLEMMQVAWCARIIQTNPYVLSRERAVRGLAEIGKRLGVNDPYLLRIDAPRASAEEITALLADMRAKWEAVRAGEGTADAWKDSLLAIDETPLDLAGYIQILPVVADCYAGLNRKDPQFEELSRFARGLKHSAASFALGEALTQKSFGGSFVRGRAAWAVGELGGALSIARLMPYLRAEHESGPDRDPHLVAELLAAVAKYGFPDTVPNVEQGEYETIRENWYSLLVAIAVTEPESRLRVKACQALATVTGEPSSLREEDWENWLYARVSARVEASRAERVPAPGSPGTKPAPIPAGDDAGESDT